MKQHDVLHAFLDALERVSNVEEYYKLNHIPLEIKRRIAGLLTQELTAIGIKVEQENDNGTHLFSSFNGKE